MVTYKFFSDSPDNYTNKYSFFSSGSSPKILKGLMEYINTNKDKIDSIYMAMYLFNNKILHNFFKKLAETGIKVRIISIPLSGYDDSKPQKIINEANNTVIKTNATKFSLAEEIYSDFKNIKTDYKLYIFPHMYIRSNRLKKFSRGTLPFSLHIKSFCINFKDNDGVVGLTSSNLAVRDLVKEEMLLFIEHESKALSISKIFFSDLISESFDVTIFDENADWFHHSITSKLASKNYLGNFFISPFYINSPIFLEHELIKLINNAKQRIYICAQHICAYDYFVNTTYDSHHSYKSNNCSGFLGALLAKADENLDIKCLSQTYVDSDGMPLANGRQPENKAAFSNFIRNYQMHKNCQYAVNNNIHSKFIIIDDLVIVTTCNFTPTQFIYLNDVKIDKFKNIPNASYHGIFSEVGQFIASKNIELHKSLLDYFYQLWDNSSTTHVI